MVRIALLADPGSGGTTVLGLLYATQVRRASTDATDLRFQVAPASIPRVSRLLEDLKAGEFPRHSGTGSPVEFLFERPRTGFASLRGRGLPGRHSPEEAISVQWTRASFADLRLHLSSGGFSSDGARQLEGADVLAVVVPARGTESTGPKPDPDPDAVLAEALSPAAVPGRSGAMPSIGLAFVFTMLDRLPEARRKELGFAGSLSDPIPPEQRERLGLGLLEQWMPRTRERLGRVLTAEGPGGGSTPVLLQLGRARSGRARTSAPPPLSGWRLGTRLPGLGVRGPHRQLRDVGGCPALTSCSGDGGRTRPAGFPGMRVVRSASGALPGRPSESNYRPVPAEEPTW